MMALALAGCDPYASWPDPEDVFPYVVSEETGLPPYAEVRVETETWTPLVDLEETALYLQKAAFLRPGAPRETLLHFAEHRSQIPPSAPSDPLVTFTGDLMMLDGDDPAGVAEAVAERLLGLRVTNLETLVAPSFPFDRDGLAPVFGIYAFNESPTILDGLPVDVIQLTNNHANDLGAAGVDETVAEVAARGFVGVGVDGNTALVEHEGLTVAFVAYTWGLNRYEPPPGADLAVVPFGHAGEVELGRVRREVRAARRAGATHVVLLVHWGYEYELYPDPHFLVLGRRLVEAGADVVVGTGPHVVQPAEVCQVNRPVIRPGLGVCSVRTPDGRPRTAAVLYSLGDFATDLASPALATGILATVSLSREGGVSGLAWDPVWSDRGGAVVRVRPLAEVTDDPELASEADRLDAHLGPGWKAPDR
jgi:hypothetical protein